VTKNVRKKKRLHIVRSYNEIRHDRVNIILGVEGGHIFDNTFKQVEVLYDLGVRVFTITWNNSNKLAYSALEADKKGLTARGKKYLSEMAGYNFIIDLSHASTRTVLDICGRTRNQVIASHSCMRAFRQKFLRNIDDRALDAIAAKDGVVGVNFSRYHLGGHGVIEHINYIRERHGIRCAAIGSDFDGINDPVIKNPAGLKKLGEELAKQGYSKKGSFYCSLEVSTCVYENTSHLMYCFCNYAVWCVSSQISCRRRSCNTFSYYVASYRGFEV